MPEVAQALCLSNAQLTALENDDYANLPGETYILGYWRGYANLLEINIDESVAAHKKYLGSMASGRMPRSRRFRGEIELSNRRLGFLSTLLSVVFLLGIWYWQSPSPISLLEQVDWQTGEVYESDDALDDGLDDADPQGWTDELAGRDEALFPILPEAMIALPEPNFSEENDPRPLALEPDLGVEYQTSNPAADSQTAQSDNLVALAAADPQPIDASIQSPPPAVDKILFVVDEESWLEVRDDAGKRLIYRTVPAGQHLTLEGMSPFSVFIGNAQGVAVHYRGEQVPFAANGGGVFARFKVGVR